MARCKLLVGGHRVVHHQQRQASQPVRDGVAEVPQPVVVVLEGCAQDLGVLRPKEPHEDAGEEDLSPNAVGVHLLHALHGVLQCGAQAVIALGDDAVGLRVVQAHAGDAQPPDAADGRVEALAGGRNLDEIAHPLVPHDARRPIAEALRQSRKDVARLHDVGVCRNSQLRHVALLGGSGQGCASSIARIAKAGKGLNWGWFVA